MDKQEQINEMIEAFKDAIGNNALIDMDAEECALDCNGVDHAAEQCAESLYNLGYRNMNRKTYNQNDVKGIITDLNGIAAKYGYGKGTEPFTDDEWNTICRAKGIIKHLTAENKRLREEAAEQKSIADHEHATQMEWFSIACDYKIELVALQKRLDNAVELPCKVGDKVYWVEDDPNIPGICEFTVQGFSFRTNNNDGLRVIIGTFLEPCVDYYKNKQLFFDRTKAEARLAELKGVQ